MSTHKPLTHSPTPATPAATDPPGPSWWWWCHLLLLLSQVSKYPETLDTRRDLKLLKWVWDFKSMCDKLFESWKQQVSERGHQAVPLLGLSVLLGCLTRLTVLCLPGCWCGVLCCLVLLLV